MSKPCQPQPESSARDPFASFIGRPVFRIVRGPSYVSDLPADQVACHWVQYMGDNTFALVDTPDSTREVSEQSILQGDTLAEVIANTPALHRIDDAEWTISTWGSFGVDIDEILSLIEFIAAPEPSCEKPCLNPNDQNQLASIMSSRHLFVNGSACTRWVVNEVPLWFHECRFEDRDMLPGGDISGFSPWIEFKWCFPDECSLAFGHVLVGQLHDQHLLATKFNGGTRSKIEVHKRRHPQFVDEIVEWAAANNYLDYLRRFSEGHTEITGFISDTSEIRIIEGTELHADIDPQQLIESIASVSSS